MADRSVMLINMPWSMPHRPSIQLGTLQSLLNRAKIRTEVRSFNLAFLDDLVSGKGDLPGEERFSFSDYGEIAEHYFTAGLGDWIFAVAPFRDPDEWDNQYLDYVRAPGGRENIIAKAVRIRQLVPSFLERCVDDVLAAAPRVVGFTATHSQNVPSLILAKLLKLRDPSLRVVFGGGNCDGPMGDALHRSFPWVDLVVRGEAERVLPELMRDLLSDGEIHPKPGLCYWQAERRMAIEQGAGAAVPMDEVPIPDYDEFFERLRKSSARAQILPHLTIPFESARGCWWGAKSHCTFCGLNGSSMAFRSKSPPVVVAELVTLARKHEWLRFNAVDNIIDMRYFRDLLPRLRDTGYDFQLFYETKANLTKEHLRAMRDSGVLEIQPGIESLSTPILKLMKKGVTALQNIRLLKWCAELGIQPAWNVIYGLPGEPPEEYGRMADVMRSLTHLTPPHLLALELDRFSPYYDRPRDYGLEITGPTPYYRLIYPCDEDTLDDLAYTFDYRYADGRDPKTYITAIEERIPEWQADFAAGSQLSYRRGPGFLLIKDRRPGLGGYDYSFGDREAAVYLGCDGGATPMALWKRLRAGGEADLSLDEIADFLDELTELKLMYEEDGTYLSLAVAVNPRQRSTAVEAEEVPAPRTAAGHLSARVVEAEPGSQALSDG